MRWNPLYYCIASIKAVCTKALVCPPFDPIKKNKIK
uniref:Uncharacterized protein n=1 Tax=Rhizophora mucronata TaxID=61149 RepID=A0A2P2M127_RHIMU